jgi:ATP-dependent Clp protease ATP-binding subunit ClpA
MFERFTHPARESVVAAQVAARRLGHDWIGTEHLLLGMLEQSDSVAARVLTELGVTPTAIEQQIQSELGRAPSGIGDAEALGAIGINLDEVRRRIEAAFGPDALCGRRAKRNRRGMLSDHIPFTPRNKKVLELSLREALRLGHKYIGTEHIMLGMIREGQGLAMLVLSRLGVGPEVLRTRILDELREAG